MERQLKKICHIKCFLTDFNQKAIDLNLELQGSLKARGSEYHIII